ncbi:protein of unknown function [Streptococcus thermophilus]|uniref:Uncharacterized protein n=2 Tax=Streptococcus thermophilus TaxID=1308 RepID=A0A8D6U6W7_STRTR|nr:protein of unknown function [Streptococcus thermophilus]CAD0144888.1 protein of unknown function [Streptococcus thermophilus]CAD0152221.1 protein of unknown function [Streptococcus thermophilus]
MCLHNLFYTTSNNKYIDISNSITNGTVPWQLFGYDYKNQDLARIIDLSKELFISKVGKWETYSYLILSINI